MCDKVFSNARKWKKELTSWVAHFLGIVTNCDISRVLATLEKEIGRGYRGLGTAVFWIRH